jgi:hypothetical protein
MKFSSQLTAATSGSANGLTASRNRGGRYFRARAIPTNPNTARQVQVRANFGAAVNDWGLLSIGDRDAWNLYASNVPVTNTLGETINLSGQQWFIAADSFALDLVDGGAAVDQPPFPPTTFSRGVLITGATTLGVAAGFSAVIDNSQLLPGTGEGGVGIYMGRPQNPTRSFFRGPWRRCFASTNTAFTGTATITTANLPFAITLGQRVWFQLRGLGNDGRLSTATIIGPLTVAA